MSIVKKILGIAAIGAFLILAGSCTKCQNCVLKNNAGAVIQTWDVCNDANGSTSAKNDCQNTANVIGGTCTCTIHKSL